MSDPYQPQPGPPIPYGQSYPPVAPEHPQGTTILVLGIVGLFVPIVSFVAWVMGNNVIKEIRASGQTYANEQNVNIGRILGIVFSIVQIVTYAGLIIFVLVVFVFAGMMAATSGG